MITDKEHGKKWYKIIHYIVCTKSGLQGIGLQNVPSWSIADRSMSTGLQIILYSTDIEICGNSVNIMRHETKKKNEYVLKMNVLYESVM